MSGNQAKQGANKGHRWKPGESGNPKGRPRNADALAATVRKLVSNEEIVKFLKGVMDNAAATTRDRLIAANMLLDRGNGRPMQTVTVFGDDDPGPDDWSGMSDDELDQIIADAEKGAAVDDPDAVH